MRKVPSKVRQGLAALAAALVLAASCSGGGETSAPASGSAPSGGGSAGGGAGGGGSGSVPKVEVAHANFDATTGAYTSNLPREGARLATYTATLPLTFTQQNGTAAMYTLEAYAAGYVTQTKAVTVGASEIVTDFTLVLAP
jgi:hypothetical protein